MNTRYPFIAVVAAAWFMAPFTVSAQTLDFDVLIDSDRSATTGCAVTPSGGATLNGFEHRLRATVDPDGSEVVALERASCAGGAFGAPVPVSGVTVPYPLALNTGSGGADAVELAVARGALGGANLSQIRLTFVTDNGSGSDVLATTDGSAGGGPIVFGLPVQIPALSIWGLGALVLVLLTLAWLAHRRMGRVGAVMAVMLVTTATWAMTFAVDGDLTDWAGRAPIAQDSTGDATDGSAAIDLVAAFVVLDGDVLFFRMDVSDTESQAPFASDDAHSTVERSLLDVAAASGLLANDNRGVPDATLTNFGGGDLGGAVTDHAAGSTVTLGADGSLTVNADGSFQFQAQTGFEGDFSFQYRIGNPLGDSDATVSIQVQTPPEAVADDFETATGDALTVATPGVLVNDTGLPDPVVASFGGGDLGGTVDDHPAGTSVSIAPDGSVAVNADGSVSFTPPTGLTGDFGFDYSIENVAGGAQAAITITVNDPPEITSADSHTCEVGSSCDFTLTADGFPAPTITIDGALPAGVTFNAATESLEGIPDAGTGAEYSLTVTADNGVQSTQNFTLTVNEPPAITSADNLTCEVGSTCDFTFTADGFPDPTFTLPGLPAGLSLDASTGVLSGTADAGTGAVHNLTLTAANGIGADASQAFTLTINEAPTITSADNLTCQVGSTCDFTFTADGFPDPTFALPGLPAGLSLDANTGVLSGTPDAGTGAEHNLTLTATNGVTPDAIQAFTLTINEAPTITSVDNLTCEVGSTCDFTFTADGFPEPTFALPGLPAGLSLDANTGILSGTPDAGTGAVHNLTLTAANGIGADAIQAFTLTINDAPTITSADNLTCEVGSTCDFTFTADGFPDPTFALPGLPAGLSLDANTGVLSGMPDVGTGAEHNLTLTATNGVTPDASQAFTLTINEAPLANNDPEGGIPTISSPGSVAYHGTFNTTLNVSTADGVLDNDTRGFPQADIVSFDNPSTGGGSVTLNADGSFGYSPAIGFTGVDSFGYCIENVGGSDCATVEVAVGERPSATADTYPQTLVGNVGIDTTADSGFSVTAGGDAITLGVASTTNGDATIDSGGTFTFNPAAGVTSANGLLEFSVTNGFGTITATITIPIGADRIWFADTNAAAGGDGRLGTPFDTLAAAETAADAVGDRIFLHTGSGDYTGGIALLNNQRLLGQGASQALVSIAGVTPPSDSVLPATAGTAPAIVNSGGNGITLAQNNRLQGFGVGNTSGSGIAGNGFGTLTVLDVSIFGTGQALDLATGSVAGAGFSSVSSSSGSRNVSLVTVGGTLNLGGGTLSGATNQGFFVDGGVGTVSYAGSISNTANRVVEIQNKTGGAVTLSGALTSNSGGTGIRVANNSGGSAVTFSGASKVLNTGTSPAVTLGGNTGATVSFTNGGLDIDTTSGSGFSATGGGTVNVTGTGNSVNTGTGIGVNIVNTTIGASHVTLQSVSVDGAGAGIILDTTGSTGHFEVTGDGASSTSETTAGRTTSAQGGGTLTLGSGGTIINTTDGVRLTSATDVFLRNLVIGESTAAPGDAVSATTVITDNGLELSSVNNLVLDNVLVSQTGDHGIEGFGSNVGLTLIHTEILNAGDNGAGPTDGDDAMDFNTGAGAPLTGAVLIQSSILAGMSDTGLEVENFSGDLDLTVIDSFIGNNHHSDANCNPCEGDGFLLRADGGSATIDMVVQNTTFNDIANDGIDLGNDQASNVSTLIAENVTGTNNDNADNLIDTANTNGTLRAGITGLSSDSLHRGTVLFFKADGAATTDVTVNNSQIQGSAIGNGIEVFIDGDPGTGSVSDGNARVLVQNTQLSNIFASSITLNVQDMQTGSSTAGFLDATLDSVTTSQPLRTDTLIGSVRGIADSGAGNGATLQLEIIDSVIGLGSFDTGFGFQAESLDLTGDSNIDIACVDDGNAGNGTPCTTHIGSTTSTDGVVADVMNESGNQVEDGGPRAFAGADVFTSAALRNSTGEVLIISPAAVTDPTLP